MRSLALFLLAFQLLAAETLVSRTQIHMGTFVTVSLPQSHQDLFEPAFNIAKNMDHIFSTYKSDAEAYKLNKSRDTHVSVEFLELLGESKKIYTLTDGYFSIAIGSITKKLYHFGESSEEIPDNEALNNANSDLLGFTVRDSSISLDKNVTLDFGGIAKGFAVDKIKSFLRSNELKRFQIAFSGDIYCEGRCDIDIQSPFEKNRIMRTINLENSGISTSGNYERYIKTKIHNHLINPKSKRSQQDIASMTLYSKVHTNTELDALATALSVMPHSKRLDLLNKLPMISYIFVTNNKQTFEGKHL
jgi:FAD:protein FMN transferase